MIGIAVITVILTLVLKRYHKEYGVIVAIIGGSILMFAIIGMLTPVTDQIRNWFDSIDIAGGSLVILVKAMGICFLTQFASDTCRDAGESALASKVELAGKISVVLIALPLFQSIASTALSLTGGVL